MTKRGKSEGKDLTVEPGTVVAARCGFCGGSGIYPFGHPPSRSNCGVCNGRGWVHIRAPYALCPACRGTGRIAGKWMTCRRCRGKGIVPVRESAQGRNMRGDR